MAAVLLLLLTEIKIKPKNCQKYKLNNSNSKFERDNPCHPLN